MKRLKRLAFANIVHLFLHALSFLIYFDSLALSGTVSLYISSVGKSNKALERSVSSDCSLIGSLSRLLPRNHPPLFRCVRCENETGHGENGVKPELYK